MQGSASTGNGVADSNQESSEMPGSGKKKRAGSGDKQEEQAGEAVNPALLQFLTTMKNDLVESTRDTVKDAVSKIETRLERNEGSIASLERRVERGEREMAVRIAAEVAKQIPTAGATAAGAGADASAGRRAGKHDAAYHYCRRSLKLWPVDDGGGGLEDAVKEFLKSKLRMTDSRIEALGSIEATALPGRAAKERREILATFETSEDRDNVKANGINLAGQRELGMSIHVPGHLMDSLVALNGLGYSIKQKKPDTKRSVKFDDVRQDLFLDICIDGQWKRIGPKEAKKVMKEVPTSSSAGQTITVDELTSLIKGGSSDESEKSKDESAVIIPDDGMET